jgi:hypothetical protein
VTDGELTAVADSRIDGYLATLAGRLDGPTATRTAILAEIRDGLLDAEERHARRGLSPVAAADAATGEFGDPAALGTEFLPELAASRARRTALGLVSTGPFVGLLWIATLLASGVLPWHLRASWRIGRVGLSLAIASGVLAALLAVAITSRLSRWLTASPRLAPTAAAAAALFAMAVDLTALTTVAAVAATRPDSLAGTPASIAALASVARLTLATRAARRCLAARAALL